MPPHDVLSCRIFDPQKARSWVDRNLLIDDHFDEVLLVLRWKYAYFGRNSLRWPWFSHSLLEGWVTDDFKFVLHFNWLQYSIIASWKNRTLSRFHPYRQICGCITTSICYQYCESHTNGKTCLVLLLQKSSKKSGKVVICLELHFCPLLSIDRPIWPPFCHQKSPNLIFSIPSGKLNSKWISLFEMAQPTKLEQ